MRASSRTALPPPASVAEELGLLIDGVRVLLPSEPGHDAEPATEDVTR